MSRPGPDAPFTIRFGHPEFPWSVVVEDDGRTAYAYFLVEGRITGDVWLFNRIPAPAEPEWRQRGPMPFANPREYVTDLEAHPFVPGSDFGVVWLTERDRPAALVTTRGHAMAIVADGCKPGWSKSAAKDGPLALVLTDEPSMA